jgi:F420-0:gamma-glutamyl ligase
VTATADQLAAAAGLLMLKDAGVPAVWIEGVQPVPAPTPEQEGVRSLLRDPSLDLFR